ncbi:hypothetical protein ACIBF1_24435 [Spirillospora sp. NPDC050679]
MRTPSRIVLSLLGSTALLVAGTTPAHAFLGTFYDDTVGVAYSGGVQGTGLGTSTLNTPTAYSLQHFCGTAQFTATISGANAWSFDSFSMSCTNNKAGTTTLNALGPISTTGAHYNPVLGGRDGLLTVSTTAPAPALRVVMTLPGVGIPSLTCDYLLASTLPADFTWFNRTNPNRPFPVNGHAQLTLAGPNFPRLRTNDARCPTSVGISAKYQVLVQSSGHDVRMGP